MSEGYTYEDIDIEEKMDEIAEAEEAELRDIDDDDILSGLDAAEIKEEKEKPKKEPKERKTKKEKPIRASRIKHKKSAVIAVAAIVLVAGVGIFYARNLVQKEQEEPTKITYFYSKDDPYSPDNITSAIDQDLISQYKFLLYGEHKAAATDTDTGYVTFSFSADDEYLGYTSEKEYDFGTYEIKSVDGVAKLVVHCDKTEDIYDVDFSDQGNIVLKQGDKVYALYQ